MSRQNNGLRGLGLVSGGDIAGLMGGARQQPLSMTPAAQYARDRREKKKAGAVESRQLSMNESAVKARERNAKKKLELAYYKELAIQNGLVPFGSGLVGSGSQGYYGGARRR